MSDKSKIVAAAIKLKYEDNIIFTGHRHGECFEKIHSSGYKFSITDVIQGFMTDDNDFLDRIEAKKYAIKIGQLISGTEEFPDANELYSEDLW